MTQAKTSFSPLFSVVIPMKNEEENVRPLIQELKTVMDSLQKPWELIVVEDGSTDQTLTKLKELAKTYSFLHILSFANNVGQSGAFDAGFTRAKGEFVITLDGDMQNDPHDIPALIDAVATCDLVCGVRINRHDPFSKRWISRISNFIRSRICQDGMRDTGCSLKIYRKACLSKIKMYHGMHRFLPALFKIEGFRLKEIPVNHRDRTKGKSNYHFFNRSIRPLVDMFAVLWMRKRHLYYTIKEEI
ncbi:MAG: glycosyltransferase family 2 protein [Chlamydiales bacterium]|nr:glycosyltransferase family 2 protein [Chlamydiales bacterium]